MEATALDPHSHFDFSKEPLGSESGSHPLRPCCGRCYSSGETRVCLTAELLPLCLEGGLQEEAREDELVLPNHDPAGTTAPRPPPPLLGRHPLA